MANIRPSLHQKISLCTQHTTVAHSNLWCATMIGRSPRVVRMALATKNHFQDKRRPSRDLQDCEWWTQLGTSESKACIHQSFAGGLWTQSNRNQLSQYIGIAHATLTSLQIHGHQRILCCVVGMHWSCPLIPQGRSLRLMKMMKT